MECLKQSRTVSEQPYICQTFDQCSTNATTAATTNTAVTSAAPVPVGASRAIGGAAPGAVGASGAPVGAVGAPVGAVGAVLVDDGEMNALLSQYLPGPANMTSGTL